MIMFLDKKYGNILKPNRHYIDNKKRFFEMGVKQRIVNLYFFNDLLLVIPILSDK